MEKGFFQFHIVKYPFDKITDEITQQVIDLKNGS